MQLIRTNNYIESFPTVLGRVRDRRQQNELVSGKSASNQFSLQIHTKLKNFFLTYRIVT